MPTKTIIIDQEINLNSIPHWVTAYVNVHASIQEHDERGEFWGTTYATKSYSLNVESADVESLRVWAHSSDGEFEQEICDELIIKAAEIEAVRLAMEEANE